MEQCKHCSRITFIRSRGLCYRCYTNPEIRKQYPLLGNAKPRLYNPTPEEIAQAATEIREQHLEAKKTETNKRVRR